MKLMLEMSLSIRPCYSKFVHEPASPVSPGSLETQDLRPHPNSTEPEKVCLLKLKTHWPKVPDHLQSAIHSQIVADSFKEGRGGDGLRVLESGDPSLNSNWGIYSCKLRCSGVGDLFPSLL